MRCSAPSLHVLENQIESGKPLGSNKQDLIRYALPSLPFPSLQSSSLFIKGGFEHDCQAFEKLASCIAQHMWFSPFWFGLPSNTCAGVYQNHCTLPLLCTNDLLVSNMLCFARVQLNWRTLFKFAESAKCQICFHCCFFNQLIICKEWSTTYAT